MKKLNIFELKDKLDTDVNNEYDILDKLCYEMDIQMERYLESDRLKSYFINKWLCTDTFVGKFLILFDGEVVGYGEQPYRKYKPTFKWKSEEDYNIVKEHIIELNNVEYTDTINLMELDYEEPMFYKLEFNSNLMPHHYETAYYNGNKVELVKEKGLFNNSVTVVSIDKTLFNIDISEIDFKIILENDKEV